ncbi:NB-ARC domain-containing protein [Streptomyces sp. NPDC020983]|uniref:NB-ARC domain-containing protein n=1 Tax=Streptomyces sp. NPDC020983 TaxID=3365106 RepID=UPI00379563FD
MRQPPPDPAAAPVAEAAAAVRTVDGLALLLRDLRRRHARGRQDSPLTYRELASRTGWSQTAIAEYFTARTLPPTDRLDGLLELLGATPAEQRALATARDRVEEAARRERRRATPRPRTAPPAGAAVPGADAPLTAGVLPGPGAGGPPAAGAAPVGGAAAASAAGVLPGAGAAVPGAEVPSAAGVLPGPGTEGLTAVGAAPVGGAAAVSAAGVLPGAGAAVPGAGVPLAAGVLPAAGAAAAVGAPPAPGVAAPRQLPAPPGAFVGRVHELALLDDAAGAGGVCAIGGMGGVGKTWLALHWAHARRDRFPDGELHADLRGFDPGGRPAAAAAAVRGFLVALGVAPAAVPAGAEAQAALYRSLTAERRMLVLLDNAFDTAQVTPLLPGGTGCTVLITSRRRLSGLIAAQGARTVALGVLPADDAHEVLARRLGRARLDAEPGAAADLVACCAGLPLALGIAAACAATHPDLPLATLAGDLGDDARRLDALDGGEPRADLRAVLSWSGRALSRDAARGFALLGLAPGPDVTPAAAAHLLDLPPAAARALLRELDHAHLVQRHAPERYRMHDLLRLHAAEQARTQLTPAGQRAAVRRLVDFRTEAACASARLIAPHQPPLFAGDTTPPPGSAPPGRASGVPAPAGAAICRTVPGMPAPGDSVRGAPAPGDTAAGRALPGAALAPGEAPGNPAGQGAAMDWFGGEHANLLAAQQAARAHGWDEQVCRLAWALDPYHRSRGYYAEQAAAWELAVESAERLGESGVRARAHQMLGDACALLGRTGDALRHLGRALELAGSGDPAVRGEIHHSLGGAWERHGDDRLALEHALRALALFRELDDTYRQARALNAVGWLRTRLGDHAEARADCLAALALLRRHPADRRQLGESSTLDSLGCIAHRRGEHELAVAYYGEALAICRAQGHSHLAADVLRHTAAALLARHRTDEARASLVRARAMLLAQHRLAEAEQVDREIADLEGSLGAGA